MNLAIMVAGSQGFYELATGALLNLKEELAFSTFELAPTASRALQRLFPEAGKELGFGLLIIEGALRPDPNHAVDRSGRAATKLIRALRESGSKLPILVVQAQPDSNYSSAPDLGAGLLNMKALEAEDGGAALLAALKHIRVENLPSTRVGVEKEEATAIEIDVEDGYFRYVVHHHRFGQIVSMPSYQSLIVDKISLENMAASFENWNIYETLDDGTYRLKDWQPFVQAQGTALYKRLIADMGAMLLDNVAATSGDYSNVHIRFCVKSKKLFSLPLEVIHDDTKSWFLRIYSPIARRVDIQQSRYGRDGEHAGPCPRVLFIEAQVTGFLGVDLDGRPEPKSTSFEHLNNLDDERALFDKWNDSGHIQVDVLDIANSQNAIRTFEERLRNRLCAGQGYDLIHFAGHSYRTQNTKSTCLILPSPRPGRVCALPITKFARWVAKAGAQFVYLSSCRGSSAQTVYEMVESGVPEVLGFRWDVDDAGAATFAKHFYDGLLGASSPISRAYLNACRELHLATAGRSPLWASPMLVMQDDDWWRRGLAWSEDRRN